ncbi:hypothetical protein [Streptacidiphilus fuscans]|uniref:Uncharacterized protein n=1 Tax=Streptacidiphilus fuscans TaxID=2789292 RepID=A0A931B4Q1_9ACTN|nr:hypothetical protein [Streptacidiphilus fuscans]MBF9066870.1 hypothetical protein [Streptacidiphilus fuscans]
MSYAVTVDTRRPEESPGLDPLQRAGVVHLLREGLDAIESIEDEDGQVVEITDHFIGVHPDGALLKVFVDAPTLEDAEAAVEAVIGEILQHSELLSEWTVDRCEVELHLDSAEESLQAADTPDTPVDGPASSRSLAARPTLEAAPGLAPGSEPPVGEDRRRLQSAFRALAPRLAGVGPESFGLPHPGADAPDAEDVPDAGDTTDAAHERDRAAAEDAALAAGALVYSIDILIDELFADIEALGDGPNAAECENGLLQLEGLPPQFAHLYTPRFARKLLVTAVNLTDRICRPGFVRPNCVAEELLLRLLLEATEATLDLHGLLDPGVRKALLAFQASVYETLDHEWLYAQPEADPLGDGSAAGSPEFAPSSIDAWFTPFDSDRPVHPYTTDAEDLGG